MEYLKCILRALSTFEIKNYIYTQIHIHTDTYAYKCVHVALCLYRCLAVTGRTGFTVFITTFDSKGSHREQGCVHKVSPAHDPSAGW